MQFFFNSKDGNSQLTFQDDSSCQFIPTSIGNVHFRPGNRRDFLNSLAAPSDYFSDTPLGHPHIDTLQHRLVGHELAHQILGNGTGLARSSDNANTLLAFVIAEVDFRVRLFLDQFDVFAVATDQKSHVVFRNFNFNGFVE